MSDIVLRVLSHAPVDTHYVAGLWHPGRASLRGMWIEARVLGASLLQPRNRDIRKFLIIARARSGSTLLTRLLNAHPDVFCGRELLARRVLAPRSYLNRLANKNSATAFGMKLLSYQMVQVQRLHDPVGFLRGLEQDGFRFIHLERDTFPQTLSLSMAQSSRLFHQRDTAEPFRKDKAGSDARRKVASSDRKIEVDIDDFIRRLKWGELLLEYEHYCLRDIENLHISYDKDLSSDQSHQQTARRVFDWIGVPPAPQTVSAGMKKVLPQNPAQVIINFDALAARMKQEGLERLLPAHP